MRHIARRAARPRRIPRHAKPREQGTPCRPPTDAELVRAAWLLSLAAPN